MQYDVIEDVFGTDPDNPDEVLRLQVHTCSCSDTSDHPPRVLRSEAASTSHLRKTRLRKVRELKGVVNALYMNGAYIIVLDGNLFAWDDIKSDVIAAATYSALDERWGKQQAR